MRKLLVLIVALVALIWTFVRPTAVPRNPGVRAEPVNQVLGEESLEELVDIQSDPAGRTLAVEPDNEPVPIEEEPLRFPGPDPIETGDCAVVMNFYDSITGEPVSGNVDLWRIGAPENEAWTAGDQKQASLSVQGGSARAESLAAGLYRAYPLFARAGAEVAPAFQIGGALTPVSIPVEMPPLEEVYLRLVDEEGREVLDSEDQRIELLDAGFRMRMGKRTPDWKVSRLPKDANALGGRGSGGGYRGSSSRDWKRVEQSASGISLGKLQGNTLEWRRTYSRKIRINGGPTTTIDFEVDGAGSYVAVLPSPKAIHDRLQFPGDAKSYDIQEDLWLSVSVVPVHEALGQTYTSRWIESEVHLRISVGEFKTVDVKWCPGKEPMPSIALVSR
jgi:hypothetical protein